MPLFSKSLGKALLFGFLMGAYQILNPGKALASDKRLQNSFGMEFVWIPAGTFTMGSPVDELHRNRDEPQHQVTITKPFYMQTTEVTQSQWTSLMASNPSAFRLCGPQCPVERVSYAMAEAFIKRIQLFNETLTFIP